MLKRFRNHKAGLENSKPQGLGNQACAVAYDAHPPCWCCFWYHFQIWLWKKNLHDKEKNLTSKNYLHQKLLSFDEDKNAKFIIQLGKSKMEKLASQHATRHAGSGRTIGGYVMERREIRRKRMRNGQHVRCELLVETGENKCQVPTMWEACSGRREKKVEVRIGNFLGKWETKDPDPFRGARLHGLPFRKASYT